MSLLMNEDFSLYQLRLGYLNQIHDGVGERLINLNPAVLNTPAFRTAGWVPDAAALKRCYSPPIPTGTSAEISSEYFQRPRRPVRGLSEHEDGGGEGRGMVTGQAGSEDTIGAAGLHHHRKREKRRRREAALEDDDSSDLSDDSDDDEKGPAQSIKFSKMPIRHRAKSSPPTQASTLKAGLEGDGPELLVTSPSKPPESTFNRLRSGSMGQVEAVKQRARRDTTTSSEMSSENDVVGAPKKFKRKLPSRPGKGPSVLALEDDIEEEDPDVNSDLDDDDDLDVGEASDLSDEFEGTAESPSMLGFPKASDDMSRSPLKPPPDMMPAVSASSSSPKKFKEPLPRLPKLPSGQRPLSMLPQPVSMISLALKGSATGSADKPFQRFADLSGKGEASPLWIKIYAPFSDNPSKPVEVPLRRTKDDRPVTVAELIGLSLWRYTEEAYKPELKPDECNINWWTLRIVDDEEIDLDFPALGRTRPAIDFTSNNNRPPNRRARDKPWDEFGLVKATKEQFAENEALTPQIGDMAPPPLPTPKFEPQQPFQDSASMRPAAQRTLTETSLTLRQVPTFNPHPNPITGPSFGPNPLRKEVSAQPADMPQREARQGAAKTGAPRTVTITHMNPATMASRVDKYETTTDSYIAEVFEQACSRLGLEKALYNLKVHGTQTVAPPDRTVEALNERLHLDLVPRRFAGPDGILAGLSGSPGSSSPNAPLELTPANATPGHTHKRKGKFTLHPLAAQQKSELNHATSILNMQTEGRRYNVLRKQPLSFAATHPRTLIITPEYMTIMPAAPDSLAAPTGKVTNVPMTSVIGAKVSRKHPKMVRILVYREKETKRYDFEAANHREAEEIVTDVRRGMEVFGQGAFED
ncbi:Putative SAPK-interacting protein 1, Pleckstrin-homology [Septoria linicola]|uniref:SAPK-interacting protein 1, Pleckstrin-homology n=1 Tax=Septoria linicola TaxID=215465 RepID=A0A9Q9EI23_9PEZI|nr:putative SAPK-interacting protein 1, Pleckstrin-homology [Septoria linicola]USW52381.1 Putative SAPK-interacting protein 1, Pleckstrin-homology [Septoria linicola]